jgi:hypothetical protein
VLARVVKKDTSHPLEAFLASSCGMLLAFVGGQVWVSGGLAILWLSLGLLIALAVRNIGRAKIGLGPTIVG